MHVQALIRKKRDGGNIARAEWRSLIRSYTEGSVPDYQMSALAMAIFLNGLDREETAALTDAMLVSGERFDLSSIRLPRVDKHSTGGVGDKVSLVLAPLVASLGVAVPMMAGRGLGHTGGTIDKLESIPGFNTRITTREAISLLGRTGLFIMSQTEEIAPADRRLYALRDATATVESIPLIAASIMSKKLAEDLTGLVLDVKRGTGAFIHDLPDALSLAETMVNIGADHGVPVIALLTAMDRPLGRACGNALEVEEAIDALRGEGPPDLMEVTYVLGAEMLFLAGAVKDRDEARRRMEVAISSGKALARFCDFVEGQGGDPRVVEDSSRLPQASEVEFYVAEKDGVIAGIDPRTIGEGIRKMGGGRSRMEDAIDRSAGFVIAVRPGDVVQAGTPLATILASSAGGIEAGRSVLKAAITIGDEAELPLPLVSHRVTEAGVEVY